MMASVIRHETKNTEFKRDWLFDRGGRSICLLTQMAMKRSTRLINNPTGPMPKILLKFVGFFSIFGVSSKMLLATLIASQQSASASPEATGSISPLIRHTYMLSPLLETLLRPHFSDKVEVMVQIRMDMAQPIEETALPAVFALTTSIQQ
jgi:hypothetical protein